jgi:hypothetical protein
MTIQDIAIIVTAFAALVNAFTTIPLAIATYRTAIASQKAAYEADLQLQESKKNSRGDFLLRLDEAFQLHRDVRANLGPGGRWYRGEHGPKFPEDDAEVQTYMGLFERIHLLIEEGIINIDTVDRLYGHRFFFIVTNPIIYQERLVKHTQDWTDFIKLWKALEQSRLKKNRSLPEDRPSPDDLLAQLHS